MGMRLAACATLLLLLGACEGVTFTRNEGLHPKCHPDCPRCEGLPTSDWYSRASRARVLSERRYGNCNGDTGQCESRDWRRGGAGSCRRRKVATALLPACSFSILHLLHH